MFYGIPTNDLSITGFTILICSLLTTIHHLAVPEDSKDSVWFTFLDPDYQYVSEESYSDISDPISYENDIKLKELMKRLVSIQKELEDMKDNANEEDFENNFYYTDFQVGLSGAISKLKTITFNATI